MKIYCCFHLQYIPGFVILVSLCILLIKRVVNKLSHTRRYKAAPQPSGALPVIGHLLLLKGPKPLSHILSDISDDYGPVFTLRLGTRRVLVVSSWEGAKDCFSNNDKALASRPAYAAGKHMGYDYAMLGFAPYGAYWRTVRKIATTELLSNARLEALKHVRLAEVDIFVKELYAMWDENGRRPVKVDLKRLIGDLSYNFIASVVAGKRYFGSNIETSEEAWRFRKAVGRLFSLLNAFVVSDMFPLLKGFDLNGKEAAMKSAARDLDLLMSSLIKEHRERRVSQEDSGDRDFVDVMLSTMDDSKFSALDSDKVIKATSLAMMLGGTDNITNSLALTLAALLDNEFALKKVQDELDNVVGKNRFVEESDIRNLSYLQAVVKEAFRLYPSARVDVPHEAMEDCQIQGYHVPAGTQVLVNIWKLQQDPNVWSDPHEFKPERFLSKGSVDVKGQHFELIPFGAGRRACPGISFSLQVMHLTLARLIQGFELQVPGDAPAEVMSSYLALDTPNSSPLEVMLNPRLSSNLLI